MSRKTRGGLLAILLLGAGLRTVGVWRPVDHPIWREADIASIARNYTFEDARFAYPRIDWRGDGPGYVEMEFPLYPWTIAALYKLFGVHEQFGRLISLACSVGGLAVFASLALSLLSRPGALAATLFVSLSPLLIEVSTSLQPEPLMFLAYVTAAHTFLRCLETERLWPYVLALVATALAVLAKVTAAHIEIFFALLALRCYGLRALRRARVWVFAIGSLLPGLLWYRHARDLWTTYGNSIGLSNEYHWLGGYFFTDPRFVKGIAHLELFEVWMPAGLLVVALGVVLHRLRPDRGAPAPARDRLDGMTVGGLWLIAAFTYYLVIGRTSGDDWAAYYHIVSVPPVALLFGSAIEIVLTRIRATSAGTLSPRQLARAGRVLFVVLIAGMLATHLHQASASLRALRPHGSTEFYECAQSLKPLIAEGPLILTSGGRCHDYDGYRTAGNASYMFYWLERRGFNICQEAQSLDVVRGFQQRGARYFIAERRRLDKAPGFEADLRRTFPLLADCGPALLFDLGTTAAFRPPGGRS